MDFIPDSGKYEIVSFICPCAPGEVNLNTPLRRVAEEVVGWATEVDGYEGMVMAERGLLPLRPVVLTLDGLAPYALKSDDDTRVGAPRLGRVGEAQLAHREAIELHRAVHAQD